MKILIIGDHPKNIGGVVNYTRPLANKLSEIGHEVVYLCTGSFNKNYNFLFFPYIKTNTSDFNFKLLEIVNCPNRAWNYDHLERDTENNAIERMFRKIILAERPDVVHIHEMMGLPVQIFEIAKNLGIPVFRTFHVYWHLCPKRVLIDWEGLLCSGPNDPERCSTCIEKAGSSLEPILNYRFKNLTPLYNILKKIKKIHKSKISLIGRSNNNPISTESVGKNLKLAMLVKKRLDVNIKMLSEMSAMNICVSNDVKRMMKNFGVPESKLLVQHIGTEIAEKSNQSSTKSEPQLNEIIVANIGGTGYYKGTHVLIEAFNRLKPKNAKLEIYGAGSETFSDIPKSNTYINLHGRYKLDELPELLKNVDIMVLPSICNDTAPQTIFESFCLGIPIIASNIGGFPDFITHGVNGLLFEPNNVEDLMDKLRLILSDIEIIKNLKSNVRPTKKITENALELVGLYRSFQDSNFCKIPKAGVSIK